MLKFTLPKSTDVYGTQKSKIFDIVAIQPSVKGIVSTTGAYINNHGNIRYWLKDKSDKQSDSANTVYYDGDKSYEYVDWYDIAVRPALQFSSIDDFANVINGELVEYKNGIKRGKVYVALDPAEKETHEELMKRFNNKELKQIKSVTFPTGRYDRFNTPLEIENNKYYEFNGKVYLYLPEHRPVLLIQNEKYANSEENVFFVVEEEWLYIDEEKKIAIPEHCWFSGIPISFIEEYPDDFDNSTMGQYLKIYGEQFLNLQKVVRERLVQHFNDLNTRSEILGKEIIDLLDPRSKRGRATEDHFDAPNGGSEDGR